MNVQGDITTCLVKLLGLVFFAVVLTGCATERGVFNYGVPSALETNRPMWPSSDTGEVPRYMFAGQLTGEDNFHEPRQGNPQSGAKSFLNWLLGLFGNEEEPLVLQRPQSGVVDESGRIYVTDVSRKAVYVFDQKEGRLEIWEMAQGTTHFKSPAGIALGTGGDIYVADADLGVVARLNRKGEGKNFIGKGELLRPVGVAFDQASHLLYVADTYGHDIKVFNEDGRLVRSIGQRGSKLGEFNYPTYLALAKGELYVTDTMNSRVQVLNADTGKARLSIGEIGLNVGDMVRPKGVAVDDNGNIYVIESYYDHLLVYNNKGEFLMAIGGTGQDFGQFYLPSGAWTDSNNRIYVSDMFNGRVVLFQFLGGEAG